MEHSGISRLPRLTAILTCLQTKRLSTATELAEKFEVSVRTIYRDIRALEAAGIPIFTEEGKGYSLVDGYRLPPVSFTESQANALITAEQLVLRNKDASFVKEYTEAITKIKAVLKENTKDKADLLSKRIAIRNNLQNSSTSNNLSVVQLALTGFNLIEIAYRDEQAQETIRVLEPFALYSTQENWILIAFCRLRNDYRTFRLDRILQLQTLSEKFEPHKMSLAEYFEICRTKSQPLT
ncbi:putative DNA-binding transcriptional regulator YafY [Pedobacter africanus]|uniref:DNA-binding transcriptional regulator YafY n=1 Tax=Pedobacter africanus TaxID=151894 RepID=A0ACC6L4R8_9SPHI|nr:YafY family protein [Pedobacter africanus]MDR6786344.1 putative DNA-binding transcriptional regulator YafY [Pedobacter africanus]